MCGLPVGHDLCVVPPRAQPIQTERHIGRSLQASNQPRVGRADPARRKPPSLRVTPHMSGEMSAKPTEGTAAVAGDKTAGFDGGSYKAADGYRHNSPSLFASQKSSPLWEGANGTPPLLIYRVAFGVREKRGEICFKQKTKLVFTFDEISVPGVGSPVREEKGNAVLSKHIDG